MLKRDLGGKLRYRGLSSPKCHGQDCIALDSIVAIKGEQNLPENGIIGEELTRMTPLEKNEDDELQKEMRAWQQLSVESLLRIQRDMILEEQVVIVTEERPA